MRIMIVTETFVPATDGICTRLANMVVELKKLQHELLIVSPELGIDEFAGVPVMGIETITVPLYGSRPWGLPSRKIKKMMQDFQPDIVHAVNPILMGTSAVHYANKLRIPLLASYHTHLPDYLDHYNMPLLKPMVWEYVRHWHRLADVNITVSHTMQEELVDQMIPVSGVLPSGINLEARHPDFYDEALYQQLTFGQANQKLLVYVGRLAQEKGLHQLKTIFDHRDDVCLSIVGDGPERESLEQLFKGTKTSFVGFQHGESLSRYFATGDGFIFPSVSETFGLVISEAMASGLPIFAAENGPTLEQIVPNETGFIFEYENSESLMAALANLDNPLLMKKVRLKTRREAEKITWQAATRSLLGFYEETLLVHEEQRDLQENVVNY